MAMVQDRTIGQSWAEEHANDEQPGQETPGALMKRLESELMPAATTAAAGGGTVDSTVLFPDDEYADVPQLGELWNSMVEQAEPFYFLSVAPRSSQHGDIFRCVIELANAPETGQFSVVFGYDPTYTSRNERLAKVAIALSFGADRVGPFKFTESVSANSQNAFKSFVALKQAPTGKGKK